MIDLATVPGLEVPKTMEGKVSGEMAGLLVDLACRDCPFITKGHEDLKSGLIGSEPDGNKRPIFTGRQCVGPTRRFLVVGRAMCHGEYFSSSL